ncbi:MAG: hypothetical protein QF752_00905 [Planctomycetota bacterium]|nr:hypothetical protein [Planctomycetota bacterium]
MRRLIVHTLVLSLLCFSSGLLAQEVVPREDLATKIENTKQEIDRLQQRVNRLQIVGRALSPQEQEVIDRGHGRIVILRKVVAILEGVMKKSKGAEKIEIPERVLKMVRSLGRQLENPSPRKGGLRDLPQKNRQPSPKKVPNPKKPSDEMRMAVLMLRKEFLELESKRLQIEANRIEIEMKMRHLEMLRIEHEMKAHEIDRKKGLIEIRLRRAELRLDRESNDSRSPEKKAAPRKNKRDGEKKKKGSTLKKAAQSKE